MASRKKVVVRQFDGTLTWGYLPFSGFLQGDDVEVLDPAGKVVLVSLRRTKTIAYVKDFNLADNSDPERIGRRTFPGRPRLEGLWLKLEFQDRDTLEGLAPFDLGFVDSLLEERGFAVSPPEGKSNTYRVFIPRSALSSVQVLGLIAGPKRKATERAVAAGQTDLFDS